MHRDIAGRPRAAPLGVLAIGLVLSACGGGGDLPDTPAVDTGARVVTLAHSGYTLRYDCDARMARRFEYTLGVDTGNAARPSGFSAHDPLMPVGCGEQLSGASYASVEPGWDRGHLVPANARDTSDADIAETFLMSNVVPQRSAFNQGVWADAERVAECQRDVHPVRVAGGVAWGTATADVANDRFTASHGLPTPERLWMVIVRQTPAGAEALAWTFVNSDSPGTLIGQLRSVDELAAEYGADAVGLSDLDPAVRAQRPTSVWPEPAGCNPA
jgi:endonuclease G